MYPPPHMTYMQVDVSGLDAVIGLRQVDDGSWEMLVEPRVTMEQLVRAAAAYNLRPPVVPEFRRITVGGSIAGIAGLCVCVCVCACIYTCMHVCVCVCVCIIVCLSVCARARACIYTDTGTHTHTHRGVKFIQARLLPRHLHRLRNCHRRRHDSNGHTHELVRRPLPRHSGVLRLSRNSNGRHYPPLAHLGLRRHDLHAF
jgi:hypothetical protein